MNRQNLNISPEKW